MNSGDSDKEAPAASEAIESLAMPYTFVTNEVETRKCSHKDLRHRQKSQDSQATTSTPKGVSAMALAKTFVAMRQKISEIEKPPVFANSPTSLGMGGPGFGYSPANSSSAADSGIGQSFDNLRDSIQKPLKFLQEKPRVRLYETDQSLLGFKLFSYVDPKDILPLLVVFIVLISSVVTIFTLTGGLNNDRMGRNGKYRSIEFGHEMSMKRRSEPKEVVDEDGNVLRGKRAAIQFAYEMNAHKKPEPEQPSVVEEESEDTIDEEELMDSLEFLKELQKMATVRKAMENRPNPDDSRKKILDELTSFGHFGTSRVEQEKPAIPPRTAEETVKPEPRPKVENTNEADRKLNPNTGNEVKEKLKRKKRSPKTKKESPFRFRKQEPMSPRKTEEKVGSKVSDVDDPDFGFR